MEISTTILDLIIKLCNIRKKLRWQIRCNYVDAQGEPVFNILFYENLSNVLKGDIAYLQSNELVVNFRFSGYYGEKPELLTDLLLDLINHEKMVMITTEK